MTNQDQEFLESSHVQNKMQENHNVNASVETNVNVDEYFMEDIPAPSMWPKSSMRTRLDAHDEVLERKRRSFLDSEEENRHSTNLVGEEHEDRMMDVLVSVDESIEMKIPVYSSVSTHDESGDKVENVQVEEVENAEEAATIIESPKEENQIDNELLNGKEKLSESEDIEENPMEDEHMNNAEDSDKSNDVIEKTILNGEDVTQDVEMKEIPQTNADNQFSENSATVTQSNLELMQESNVITNSNESGENTVTEVNEDNLPNTNSENDKSKKEEVNMEENELLNMQSRNEEAEIIERVNKVVEILKDEVKNDNIQEHENMATDEFQNSIPIQMHNDLHSDNIVEITPLIEHTLDHIHNENIVSTISTNMSPEILPDKVSDEVKLPIESEFVEINKIEMQSENVESTDSIFLTSATQETNSRIDSNIAVSENDISKVSSELNVPERNQTPASENRNISIDESESEGDHVSPSVSDTTTNESQSVESMVDDQEPNANFESEESNDSMEDDGEEFSEESDSDNGSELQGARLFAQSPSPKSSLGTRLHFSFPSSENTYTTDQAASVLASLNPIRETSVYTEEQITRNSYTNQTSIPQSLPLRKRYSVESTITNDFKKEISSDWEDDEIDNFLEKYKNNVNDILKDIDEISMPRNKDMYNDVEESEESVSADESGDSSSSQRSSSIASITDEEEALSDYSEDFASSQPQEPKRPIISSFAPPNFQPVGRNTNYLPTSTGVISSEPIDLVTSSDEEDTKLTRELQKSRTPDSNRISESTTAYKVRYPEDVVHLRERFTPRQTPFSQKIHNRITEDSNEPTTRNGVNLMLPFSSIDSTTNNTSFEQSKMQAPKFLKDEAISTPHSVKNNSPLLFTRMIPNIHRLSDRKKHLTLFDRLHRNRQSSVKDRIERQQPIQPFTSPQLSAVQRSNPFSRFPSPSYFGTPTQESVVSTSRKNLTYLGKRSSSPISHRPLKRSCIDHTSVNILPSYSSSLILGNRMNLDR